LPSNEIGVYASHSGVFWLREASARKPRSKRFGSEEEKRRPKHEKKNSGLRDTKAAP